MRTSKFFAKALLLATASVILSSGAYATTDNNVVDSEKVDSTKAIAVANGWALPTPSNAPAAAVYLEITNNSAEDISITGVTTTVAKTAELSNSTIDKDGKAQMTSINNIIVPAAKPPVASTVPAAKPPVASTVTLKPGGLHIMLSNLKQNLVAGQQFKLHLTTTQGPVEANITVGQQPNS